MSKPAFSQLHVLKNDWWLLSCLTWIPIVLVFFVWLVFSDSMIRDLPFGVVIEQESELSRILIREFDATPTLSVDYTFSSTADAQRALRNNAVYGYAVIPASFVRDLYQSGQPDVTVFYNSQYMLVGRLINGSVNSVIATFNAQLGSMKTLAKGNTTQISALASAITIQNQITPLFNKNTDYNQFLVGAAVPAIWQIMLIITTVMILAANHRIYGHQKMADSGILRSVANITSFYLPIFMCQGVAFVLWFYLWLEWPMNGSLTAIIFAQLLTILACVSMGSFFFFISMDAARAMSFAGAFTAPSFAFMGVTFPVTDMNNLATIWRSFLPVSHYIEIQIEQSSYGVTSWQAITSLVPMLLYGVPFALVAILSKKHLTKRKVL